MEKIERATLKKCRENFSVLGRKLLQNLLAESRAKPVGRRKSTFFKSFLEKS